MGDVHSEQGTLGVSKQMRDKKENTCFKENVEQRLAARKHHLVSGEHLLWLLGHRMTKSSSLSPASPTASLCFYFGCVFSYRAGG